MTTLALQTSGPATIIYFVAMVAIMYFLVILPQRRERKRHLEIVAALKPSDQVVTMGGLVGEIISIKDEMVTLKTGDSRVVVERARIARLLNAPTAA